MREALVASLDHLSIQTASSTFDIGFQFRTPSFLNKPIIIKTNNTW